MKELDLTQGSVPKVLLQFAVPFLIANVLQALYGGADLFVVGQYDDSASVAAVAIGSQVMHHYRYYLGHYHRNNRTDCHCNRSERRPASGVYNRFFRLVVFNYRHRTYSGHGIVP